MTQYRWIVLSHLAVFLLSAVCTARDEGCRNHTSCDECMATKVCQWCTFGDIDSHVFLNIGICQERRAECAPRSITGFIPGSIIGGSPSYTVINLQNLQPHTCLAKYPISFVDDNCLNCVNTDGNQFCRVSRGGMSTDVCHTPTSNPRLGDTTPCDDFMVNDNSAIIESFTADCCKQHTNCQDCNAAGPCSWCMFDKRNDGFLNPGICQTSSDCSNAHEGLAQALGFKLIRVGVADDTRCKAAAPLVLWDATTCSQCVGDHTHGHWCTLTVGDKSEGICLANAASCADDILKGGELPLTVSPPLDNLNGCCLNNDNCQSCYTETGCSWCSPIDTPSGSRLNLGVCQNSSDCANAYPGLTRLGFTSIHLRRQHTHCTSYSAAATISQATTCTQCTAHYFAGHWCRLKKNGKQAGLCVKNENSCTIPKLSTGTVPDLATDNVIITQSASCCSQLHNSCAGCTGEHGCSWCFPNPRGYTLRVVYAGVCVLTSSENGSDTSCSNVTIGNLEGEFVISHIESASAHPAGKRKCTSRPAPSFESETTCATCIDAGHSWCPVGWIVTKANKSAICSTETCTDLSDTSGVNHHLSDALERDECDGEKESTAFSMFSGSAIGFISAVAISGFVM